jgi:L-fuconolactonase
MSDAEELVLEPDLPIVDPHHHLWDGTPLVPESGTYLLAEYLEDLGSGHRIEASVFVEAHSMYRACGPEELRPVGEVEFANGVAAMSASGRYGPTRVCTGIVGHADLRLGDRVAGVLEALVRAGGGRLRGIRHMTATDADGSIYESPRPPGLMLDPGFRAGVSRLASFGLSFDTWAHHTQLDEVIDLARRSPETTLIVNHAGGPLRIGRHAARPEEAYADWRRGIERLARCPNTIMKLGGLGMRFLGFPTPASGAHTAASLAALWRPYLDPCIQAFSPARCMFESNFPVDRRTCTYRVLWNAFKTLAAGCSPAEKDALFKGTATRIYRLVS